MTLLDRFRGKFGKAVTLFSLLSLLLTTSCSSKRNKNIKPVSTAYEQTLEYKTEPFEKIIETYSDKFGLKENLLKSVLAADLEHVNLKFIKDRKKFAHRHLIDFIKAARKNNFTIDHNTFKEYLGNYDISDKGEIDSYADRVLSFEYSFDINGLYQRFSNTKAEDPRLERNLLSAEQERKTDEKLQPFLEDIVKYAKEKDINPLLLKSKIAVDLASINPNEISNIEGFIQEAASDLELDLDRTNNDKYSALIMKKYANSKSLADVIEEDKESFMDLFFENNPVSFFNVLPDLKDGQSIKRYLESVLKYELAFRMPDGKKNAAYDVYIIDPGHGFNPEDGESALYNDNGSLHQGPVRVKGNKFYDSKTGKRIWKGDKGATHGELEEHKLTYAVAEAVQYLMENQTNSKIVLTRGENQFVSLPYRVGVARQYSPDNSLFLSVHFDDVGDSDANPNGCRGFNSYQSFGDRLMNSIKEFLGFETEASYSPAELSRIRRMERNILRGLDSLGIENRGLAQDKEWSGVDFYVLKGLRDRPAMLIETSFLRGDYKNNVNIMNDPYYTLHLGQSFVNGIK